MCCTKVIILLSAIRTHVEQNFIDLTIFSLTTHQSDVNRALESILNLNWQLVKKKKKPNLINSA